MLLMLVLVTASRNPSAPTGQVVSTSLRALVAYVGNSYTQLRRYNQSMFRYSSRAGPAGVFHRILRAIFGALLPWLLTVPACGSNPVAPQPPRKIAAKLPAPKARDVKAQVKTCGMIDATATPWSLRRPPQPRAKFWFSPTGGTLIVSVGGVLTFWDTHNGAVRHQVAIKVERVLPNGLILAKTKTDSGLDTLLLDPENGTPRQRLPGFPDLSPDGAVYAIVVDGWIIFRDTMTKAELRRLKAPAHFFGLMSRGYGGWPVSPLAVGTRHPTRGTEIFFYDWRTAALKGRIRHQLQDHRQQLSPDGKTLAVWEYDDLWLLDVKSARVLGHVRFPANNTTIFHGYGAGSLGWANDVVFSPNSRWLAVRYSPPAAKVNAIEVETRVAIINARKGRLVRRLPHFFKTGAALSFTADSRTIVTKKPNQRGHRAFSVRTGRPLGKVPALVPLASKPVDDRVWNSDHTRYAVQAKGRLPSLPTWRPSAIEIRAGADDRLLHSLGVRPLQVTSFAVNHQSQQLAWLAQEHVTLMAASGKLTSWPTNVSGRSQRELLFSKDGDVLVELSRERKAVVKLGSGTPVVAEKRLFDAARFFVPPRSHALQEQAGVRPNGQVYAITLLLASKPTLEGAKSLEAISRGPDAKAVAAVENLTEQSVWYTPSAQGSVPAPNPFGSWISVAGDKTLSVWHADSGKRLARFRERKVHSWGWVDHDTLFALVSQPDRAGGKPMRWIRFYELKTCSTWSLVPLATSTQLSWAVFEEDHFDSQTSDMSNLFFFEKDDARRAASANQRRPDLLARRLR